MNNDIDLMSIFTHGGREYVVKRIARRMESGPTWVIELEAQDLDSVMRENDFERTVLASKPLEGDVLPNKDKP